MHTTDHQAASLFLIPFILALAGLLMGIALLQGQRDLTILILILFGIAAGARLWGRWGLTGTRCMLSPDKQRLFPGETLHLEVSVENRKWLPIWVQVRLAVPGLTPPIAGTVMTAEAGLLWHQRISFDWELDAERRGVHQLGPLMIQAGDLFGFFPKRKRAAEPFEVIVYPRLVPLKPLTVPHRDLFGLPGGDSPVKDPVYLLGTRDYQHGQPAKHIHWKATARHHRLQEKLFEPSAQEKVLLLVDCSPFTTPGEEEAFEALLSTVASAAVQLAGRGCAVGLASNGRMNGPGSPILSVSRGPRQLMALLEILARLRPDPVKGLLDQLRLHPYWSGGISGLYFSRTPDAMLKLVKGYFAQRRIPLHFCDQETVGLPTNKITHPLAEKHPPPREGHRNG